MLTAARFVAQDRQLAERGHEHQAGAMALGQGHELANHVVGYSAGELDSVAIGGQSTGTTQCECYPRRPRGSQRGNSKPISPCAPLRLIASVEQVGSSRDIIFTRN